MKLKMSISRFFNVSSEVTDRDRFFFCPTSSVEATLVSGVVVRLWLDAASHNSWNTQKSMLVTGVAKQYLQTTSHTHLSSISTAVSMWIWLIDWVVVLRPTRHKAGHFGDVLPSQSLDLVLKNWSKHNKSKHTSITKYTTTQNLPKTHKARLSHLLWHPALKWKGPILVSALHKSVTYLLT